MNGCEAFEIDLVDAASGELAPERRAGLDAHLALCASCRAELGALGATSAALERTANRPDELHLTSFALRTADRAVAFRDRSVRGAWWALLRPYRLALGVSLGALAASLFLVLRPAVHPGALHPGPAVAHVTATSAGGALASDFAAADGTYQGDDVNLDSALDVLADDELDSLNGALDYVSMYDPS